MKAEFVLIGFLSGGYLQYENSLKYNTGKISTQGSHYLRLLSSPVNTNSVITESVYRLQGY